MIEALLIQNEGKTIEFKETTRSLNGIIKTVIAFANTAGGTIVIGVRDGSKEIVGLTEILQEEERLTNAISDSIVPLLMPDIEIQTIRGKEVLILQTPHSIGPYYLKSEGPDNGVYIRFGSTNRIADAETVSALRLLAKNISYDELPHPYGQLDFEAIKSIFASVSKRPTESTFESFGVTTRRTGKPCPTNGGILLFGLDRLKFFPDSLIRCARFAGDTKEEDFRSS